MRLNPVVKIFPSARKIALIGRAPSWALSFSWKQQQTCQKCFTGVLFYSYERNVLAPVRHSYQNPLQRLPTLTIFFLRGSMTRTFLSLQAVHSRLPLRLQLTLKITSGCMSSRLITASPVPTFQMTIWLSQPENGHAQSLSAAPYSRIGRRVIFREQNSATEGNHIIGPILSSAVCSK